MDAFAALEAWKKDMEAKVEAMRAEKDRAQAAERLAEDVRADAVKVATIAEEKAEALARRCIELEETIKVQAGRIKESQERIAELDEAAKIANTEPVAPKHE